MSLSSLLAMVDGAPPPAKPATPNPVASTSSSVPSSNPKRKAGTLDRPEVKHQRQEPVGSSAYKGTSASGMTARPQAKPVPPSSRSGSNTPATNGLTKSSQAKPNTPSTSSPRLKPAAPSAPAVKGSFADIMNRAKSLASTAPEKPRYVNKATEIKKKEDRKKQLQKDGSKSKSASGSRSGSAEPSSLPRKSQAAIKEREKPKQEVFAYKGTARPTAPVSSYKGTSRPAPLSKKPMSSFKPLHSRDRYSGYEEHDEEDEEDDYSGYESSDMEAGILDIDDEEEEALRAARKEDAAALRQENELKRQKALRKEKGFSGSGRH